MSRIGRLPVPVGSGVQVTIGAKTLRIQGPKGALEQALPEGITAEMDGAHVVLKRREETKSLKALHGLSRALLANAVQGVTRGFTRELESQGVGYRAQLEGRAVLFSLGFTHPIRFSIPEGIQIAVDKQTRITVSGVPVSTTSSGELEHRNSKLPSTSNVTDTNPNPCADSTSPSPTENCAP